MADLSGLLSGMNLTALDVGIIESADLEVLVGFLLIILALFLIGYLYFCFTLMLTARKLDVPGSGLAFVPFVNLILMARMAGMSAWPVLLLFGIAVVPVVGALFLLAFMAFFYIWWWKIAEKRGMEGWLVLLTFVPLVGSVWGLILWGLLAWKETPTTPGSFPSVPPGGSPPPIHPR
jgi:hypothetical protein